MHFIILSSLSRGILRILWRVELTESSPPGAPVRGPRNQRVVESGRRDCGPTVPDDVRPELPVPPDSHDDPRSGGHGWLLRHPRALHAREPASEKAGRVVDRGGICGGTGFDGETRGPEEDVGVLLLISTYTKITRVKTVAVL